MFYCPRFVCPEGFVFQVLIPVIKALIIHDSDGDRLFAKYYDGRVKTQQIEFESMLHKKTKATNAKNEGIISRCSSFLHRFYNF